MMPAPKRNWKKELKDFNALLPPHMVEERYNVYRDTRGYCYLTQQLGKTLYLGHAYHDITKALTLLISFR